MEARVLTAFFYAVVLAYLPQEIFLDRVGYFELLGNGFFYLEGYFSSGWIAGMTNEPLFLWLGGTLSKYISPEEVTRLVVMVPAFLVAYYTLKYEEKSFWILLLFLLLPQVLKNHLIHIRQGFAISLFMIGWYTGKKFWMILSPFIHASFFIVGGWWLLNEIITRLKIKFEWGIAVIVLYAGVLSFFLGDIAGVFGARQALYSYGIIQEVSGLGFLYWGGITGLFFLQGKEFVEKHRFAVGILLIYLGTYYFVQLSPRIFESGLLVVLITILNFSKWKHLTIFLLVLYAIYFYVKNGSSFWIG